MNAVEIEEAVSQLVEQPFDPAEFPYQFLEAFGNKTATIKRLRSAGKTSTNKSDVDGDGIVAALQRNNIHLATLPAADSDAVGELLKRLANSPATAKHKAKFALATDGHTLQAENRSTGETLACEYAELGDHFGFFLELAGISTVRQIRENAFDIKATGRLNRLYVELLRNNPDWDDEGHRQHLNHFFARLIFCFFAEDTGIFRGDDLFTETVRQMSEPSGENTHWVLAEIFRAMDVPLTDRDAAGLRPWAGQFPYVNGGLFGNATDPHSPLPVPGRETAPSLSGSPRPASGRGAGGEGLSAGKPANHPSFAHAKPGESGAYAETQVPKFTRIARSYLLHIGSLDWTQVNPDIFGSMIQAVADDEERGALGMHYTSVPNILKVLDPLFLDELRDKLEEAGDNARKLLNLRKRLARIRVFDPACGSGNFLVIAYKQMREIEAEINKRRGEGQRATDIPLTNFRGIEIRHFAAEVARLALIIAEYQCDVLHRGQRLALAEFLPLDSENWITHGNALRLDWLKVCPPTGTGGMKLTEDDLFQTPLDQIEIDFENEGGETYICGNPPYIGSTWQSREQKEELRDIFEGRAKSWKSLDYVAGWFMKAADYGAAADSSAAFVATKSVCQGQQVPILWPVVFKSGRIIDFAYSRFRWSNLAGNNAGVTVVIVGMSSQKQGHRRLFVGESDGEPEVKFVSHINAYLVAGSQVIVHPRAKRPDERALMEWGNKPTDGGNLFLSFEESQRLARETPGSGRYIKRFLGAKEFIRGEARYCLWIEDDECKEAEAIPEIARRIRAVAEMRANSKAAETRPASAFPHRFRQIQSVAQINSLVVARVSSEHRDYLPVGLEDAHTIIGDRNFALYDAPLWNMALIASRIHWVWIGTVCVRMRTDFSYSNTLGWNTFPIPPLTNQNKADLTRCAEDILLAREAHWPATIAELYDPDKMPEDLRAAHDRNDETLERIYIGRRFKNDTERLETLFQMYTEMTAKAQ